LSQAHFILYPAVATAVLQVLFFQQPFGAGQVMPAAAAVVPARAGQVDGVVLWVIQRSTSKCFVMLVGEGQMDFTG
jgi:hypothetical protein